MLIFQGYLPIPFFPGIRIFLENLQKPGKTDPVFGRMMVEKNEESNPRCFADQNCVSIFSTRRDPQVKHLQHDVGFARSARHKTARSIQYFKNRRFLQQPPNRPRPKQTPNGHPTHNQNNQALKKRNTTTFAAVPAPAPAAPPPQNPQKKLGLVSKNHCGGDKIASQPWLGSKKFKTRIHPPTIRTAPAPRPGAVRGHPRPRSPRAPRPGACPKLGRPWPPSPGPAERT